LDSPDLAEQPIPSITTGVDNLASGLEDAVREAIVSEMHHSRSIGLHSAFTTLLASRRRCPPIRSAIRALAPEGSADQRGYPINEHWREPTDL
jgi:hypothetical protein